MQGALTREEYATTVSRKSIIDDNKEPLEAEYAGWSVSEPVSSHHIMRGAARERDRPEAGGGGGAVSSCLLGVGGLQVL